MLLMKMRFRIVVQVKTRQDRPSFSVYNYGIFTYDSCNLSRRYVAWSMCLSGTVEPIEMPFGLGTRVGPRNKVVGEGPDPIGKRGNFWGNFQSIIRYRDLA